MSNKRAAPEAAITAERRDEVIKRMLATPPKPHDPSKAKKKGREPKPAPKVK